jgi:hypothetical protein
VNNTGTKKGYEINGILKGKKWRVCSMFKKFSTLRIFVEKIYKIGCFEGSGVPVLYIGRTVRKG